MDDRPTEHARLAGLGAGDAAAETDQAGLIRERVFDDRARSRVPKLIHRAVARIRTAHGFLGDHLAASISTGYVCRYVPEQDVRWRC